MTELLLDAAGRRRHRGDDAGIPRRPPATQSAAHLSRGPASAAIAGRGWRSGDAWDCHGESTYAECSGAL
jgi:hypothetical protein